MGFFAPFTGIRSRWGNFSERLPLTGDEKRRKEPILCIRFLPRIGLHGALLRGTELATAQQNEGGSGMRTQFASERSGQISSAWERPEKRPGAPGTWLKSRCRKTGRPSAQRVSAIGSGATSCVRSCGAKAVICFAYLRAGSDARSRDLAAVHRTDRGRGKFPQSARRSRPSADPSSERRPHRGAHLHQAS